MEFEDPQPRDSLESDAPDPEYVFLGDSFGFIAPEPVGDLFSGTLYSAFDETFSFANVIPSPSKLLVTLEIRSLVESLPNIGDQFKVSLITDPPIGETFFRTLVDEDTMTYEDLTISTLSNLETEVTVVAANAAIPEPSSLLLVATIGMGFLGVRRYRRRTSP